MTNDKDLCDVFRNHSLNELCNLSTNSDNQYSELLKIDLTKLHNHFSYLLNSCEHLLIECNRLFALSCTSNKNNLSSVISTNSIQHDTTENNGSLSLLPPIKYDDLIKSGSQLFSNDCHGLENSWLHHFTSNIKGNDFSDLSDCNKSIDSILSNSSFNDFGVSNVSDELNNVHQTTEFFHLINMIQADKSTRQNVNNLDVKSLIKLYNLKQITNVLQYFVQSIPYHSLCLLHYCQYDEKYTNSINNLSESLNEYEQCQNISKLPIQTITSIMHNNSLMNTFNETMNKSSNRIKNSITLLNESDSKSFNEVLINSSLNQINCIVNDNKNHNDHNNTVVNDNDDNNSLYQYKYSFNAVFNRKNYNLYELINHERLLRNNSSFIYNNNNKSHLLSAYNLSSSTLLQSDILSLPSTNIPYENKSKQNHVHVATVISLDLPQSCRY
ncbi:hypothetical protein EWB00_010740 [Schistosoma japonicum]|uniref:Uncharacterized protein n=1 Tax=Schistosoma japonicum TaxID=6182 RepID=A0A4Z2DNI0_SCHJA|nr:hypothetical protein EWB00_010740 [Schistosoma japonicum]